jgi:hypothetical protein
MFQIILKLLIINLAASCVANKSRHGRVEYYNSGDRGSFVFSVSDDFVVANKDSPQDQKNPKITKAESDLLASLLKEKKLCINSGGSPSFKINSRQEKIYDATFAHLIEKNYRARPLVPRTYSGKCL